MASTPLPASHQTAPAAAAMRYPNQYVWMLFFGSLDVILTGLILTVGGGGVVDPDLEINPVARLVIAAWGMPGATLFKFSILIVVIIICEVVGRSKDLTGRGLAWTSVVISAFPVVWSLTLLFANRLTFFDPLIRLPAV